MNITFNTETTALTAAKTLESTDGVLNKNIEIIKLPAKNAASPADEGELIEIGNIDDLSDDIDEIFKAGNAEETKEAPSVKNKKPDISSPREINTEVSEEQQKTVDNFVDSVTNLTDNDEILDNVMYNDGNVKTQVVTKKTVNDDGTVEYHKITISYDENGRVKSAETAEYPDENFNTAIDGYKIGFTYNNDGTITAQKDIGWDAGNGSRIGVMVYYPPTIINQDGTTSQNVIFGKNPSK